jgi:lambda family phage minor tail protein L
MTLINDAQKSWHDAIVEMFDIDLSPITNDPADIYYFTNQVKEDGTKVQWKGNIYEPLPILAAGYDRNTNGQVAQPSLTVANVLGTFSQVVKSFDDLVGGKVTRRRTLEKYLDGSPQADTLQEFPIDIFYIERKTQETAIAITWQLSSILDLEGVRLPRRVITQNLCLWKYRSSECGYTGAPAFNSRDQIIGTEGQSTEAVTAINAWYLREQRKTELRTATEFRNQAAGNKEAACASYVLLESRFTYPFPVNYVIRLSSGDAGPFIGYWDGVAVTIGLEYRQGPPGTFPNLYEIERWGPDAAGCTTATNALASAEAALTTAQNNLSSAEAALSAAIAALPTDDPLRLEDICGKRVSSCTLRFPEQSLPFGGFPGANLTRS